MNAKIRSLIMDCPQAVFRSIGQYFSSRNRHILFRFIERQGKSVFERNMDSSG